ncbi:MAG TPA: hypothetical protein VN282_25075 [Pyrinomonadaceae bacterium]|nr:hypothetical protein [Pyrinomonadaceae bacterium]
MKKKVIVLQISLLLFALSPACRSSEATRLREVAAETRKGDATTKATPLPLDPAEAKQIATLEDRKVRESSGLAASRRSPDLFWTHNDSGDGPFVYAFDRGGRARGTFRVEGAQAVDWEDISAGPGPARGQSYLYAADIGDNGRKREFVVVYRFPEPEVSATEAPPEGARVTQPAEAIRLKYPDGAHNAEALAVHPTTGDIYIVTKANAEAGVYKLPAPFDPKALNTLTKVATLRGPDFFGTLVTGADISPDGRRVALCDYAQGYELTPPEGAKGFDEVWKQTPAALSLGARLQGESVAYRLDGAALLATSEKTPTPLFETVLPKR